MTSHPGDVSSLCRTSRVPNKSPTPHINTIYNLFKSFIVCETNAVSYEAHGDHRLRAWQIHRRSCHIDAPRQPLGDNSTGIYLTGKCTTEEKHGKSARSSKKVHPDCYVYTTSIKIAEFIFPTSLTTGSR